MKQYFKYSSGYVNINDEHLFMTNSGNWSETHTLEEKSSKTEKANNRKNLKFDFLIFVLIICIAFVVYDAFNSRGVSRSLPMGLIVLALALYRYFKNETGKKIKIPLAKIINVEVTGNKATIFFYNKANEKDSEELSKIDSKGIQLLEQLNLKPIVQ